MAPADHAPQKAALRKTLLKTRRSLSSEEWREKSDRLCTHLHQWPELVKARTILAYFSFRQEPDLSPLFHQHRVNPSQRWGFPCCVGQSLIWHSWSPGDRLPLQQGAYGILEPHPDAPILTPSDVDLLLVPSVACDRRGYRLGYGGGFYDRLFSQSEWMAKPAIGIVFDFAVLPELPLDPWDRPLAGVCTEVGWVAIAD